MAIVFTNCPRCAGEVQTSDRFIDGAVVISCPKCRAFWLEGDDAIAPAGSGPATLGWLKDRHASLAREADQERRFSEMMESDIGDPRWSGI